MTNKAIEETTNEASEETTKVKVLIPTPLQKVTDGKKSIECSAGNINELIDALEESCPGMKKRLCDEEGKLRRFINLYLNQEDIRFLDGDKTALKGGDEVSIIMAVAGG